MESPARYTPHQSKKRVFPESSSSCMDPDVVEISPPTNGSLKSKLKRKQVAHHEVINIDPDDDPDGVVIIDDELDFSYKGKQSGNTSYNNMTMPKATNGVQSSKNLDVQETHEFFGNGFSEHDFVSEDAYMDLFQDGSIFDDDYAFLQAQFDCIDIPTEIEAPVPWFTDPVETAKKVGSISSSNYPFRHVQLHANGIGSSHAGGKDWTSPSSSCWQTQVTAKPPYGTRLSSSSAFPKSSLNNYKPDSPAISNNLSSNIVTCKPSLSSKVPWNPPVSSSSKWKYVPDSSLRTPGYIDPGSVELPSQRDSYLKKTCPHILQNNGSGKDKLTRIAELRASNLSHSVKAPKPVKMGSFSSAFEGIYKQLYDCVHLSPGEQLVVNEAVHPYPGSTAAPGSTSSTKDHGNHDDIMKNLQLYKQFDTVEDYSDHHYSGSSVTQQPKVWAKRIQEEWKILEKDLPDTIFVRVYESRMDLLRAVIVGAQGTPYHDGLFFFDVFFPSGYPSVPPHVYYHSGGLRINPNLYNNGKVCLSLLNTWSGRGNEKWIPNVSTMLQVLVSVQALILNEKPYFNEPGYASSARSPAGEQSSQIYSENAFLLSLKTMVYTMRKPPKHFEDFVIGHFCKHVQDILGACKVYIEEGVEVGSVTKGGVKNLQGNAMKCSPHFKVNLASHISMLVQAFVQIGAKDCDKFLSLAQMAGGNNQLPSCPPPVQIAGSTFNLPSYPPPLQMAGGIFNLPSYRPPGHPY